MVGRGFHYLGDLDRFWSSIRFCILFIKLALTHWLEGAEFVGDSS